MTTYKGGQCGSSLYWSSAEEVPLDKCSLGERPPYTGGRSSAPFHRGLDRR